MSSQIARRGVKRTKREKQQSIVNYHCIRPSKRRNPTAQSQTDLGGEEGSAEVLLVGKRGRMTCPLRLLRPQGSRAASFLSPAFLLR
jgi:hypothetical protein